MSLKQKILCEDIAKIQMFDDTVFNKYKVYRLYVN